MKKRLKSFGLAIALIAFSIASVHAAKTDKFALVIGNSDYTHIPKLKNPANDAKDMAKALKKLDFDVTLLRDASKLEIEFSVKQFTEKLKETGGVGMFFYAGHGSQLEGDNYLVPVNVNVTQESEIKSKAYNIAFLLGSMRQAKNNTNIIVLDACRDNPFKELAAKNTRSAAGGKGGRGLVKINAPELNSGLSKLDAPPNTLIAYATAPGKVALDGSGRNSPYTRQLVKAIQREGLTVDQVFKEVRAGVLDKTKGAQIPWESSSLVADFYFKPRRTIPAGW